MKKVLIIVGSIIIVVIAVLIINKLFANSKTDKPITTIDKIAVETVLSSTGDMEDILSYTGTVEGIHEAEIMSQTAGVVTKMNMVVGKKVSDGTVLAVIQNAQQAAVVDQAKASVLAAENNYEKAQADLKRMEKLQAENVATKDNLELAQLNVKSALSMLKGAQASLKVAEKQLDDTYIKSTIPGVISTKEIDQGATVTPGTKIAKIVDVSKFKIIIMVSEYDAVKLSPGRSVTVKLDAQPDKSFEGKINSIGLSTSEGMKSYPVEVYMEKPGDSEIKSGMFARCEIYARTKKNVVIAPENAITINNDGSAFVYVDDNGKAVQKQVKLGVKNDGKYEIASGLEPNVKIITAGKERLKDGILIVENAK